MRSQGKDSDRLIDENDAAAFLGMTVASLRSRRVRGGSGCIPYIKLGKTVRYSMNALERHLTENTHDSGEREFSQEIAR